MGASSTRSSTYIMRDRSKYGLISAIARRKGSITVCECTEIKHVREIYDPTYVACKTEISYILPRNPRMLSRQDFKSLWFFKFLTCNVSIAIVPLFAAPRGNDKTENYSKP